MARPLTTEEWHVLVRLERWKTEIDAVLRMLSDQPTLTSDAAERARERFGWIKHQLRAEADADAKVRRFSELSAPERHWYQPTIRMAYCALQSKMNTRPSSLWSSELSAARNTITHAIRQLMESAAGERRLAPAVGDVTVPTATRRKDRPAADTPKC